MNSMTTYSGYYTIPLNTEIVFNQGDRFSVVISFASPTNQTLYAFIDKSSSLESLHFVSRAEIGQSYYRTKANGWMDISYQQINNRIKAFTENTTEAATEILANVSALPKSSIRKIKSSRCSSLRLSWNAVQYADGYQIFRSTSRKTKSAATATATAASSVWISSGCAWAALQNMRFSRSRICLCRILPAA